MGRRGGGAGGGGGGGAGGAGGSWGGHRGGIWRGRAGGIGTWQEVGHEARAGMERGRGRDWGQTFMKSVTNLYKLELFTEFIASWFNFNGHNILPPNGRETKLCTHTYNSDTHARTLEHAQALRHTHTCSTHGHTCPHTHKMYFTPISMLISDQPFY